MLAVTPLNSSHPALAALIGAGLSSEHVAQVLAFYDEPHRHYHNRVHLREMFDAAAQAGCALTPAQTLAVLFHDVIYVPGAARGSNEMMSAQLLRVYGRGLPPALVDEACSIVLDTADHRPHSESARLVLDLDLLRLAASPADFERYSREVFDEQRPLIRIDDEQAAWHHFLARRVNFFQQLLDRPEIFSVPQLRSRYESVTRRNLERAISSASALH